MDSFCSICCSSCGVSVHRNMSSSKRRLEIFSRPCFPSCPVGVLHHTPCPRESDKDASQPLHLRNRECGKQLNISWNGVNLPHCNLPVYLGVTLDRTLSYKAHIEKTKKKVGTRNNITKNGEPLHATTLRSSALALCYSAAEYACRGSSCK